MTSARSGTNIKIRKLMMDTTVDALIVDLLEWLTTRDRTYQEIIDVWRTSCPRLPVWEDANDRGLVAREYVNGLEVVGITPAGSAYLQQRGRSQTPEKSAIPPTR
jgi:hypothetical protein